MSQLLFEVIQEAKAYRVIRENKGHFLVQEDRGRNRRSYRINRRLFKSIKGAPDTFKAAKDHF